jgi:DedD protein
MRSDESQDSNAAPSVQNDSAQIRRKLAWRMGIAGMMIVALLGGLALFDYLAADQEEEEVPPPRYTEPVPAPKKSVTETSGPVVPIPDEEAEKQSESVPESSEAPASAITASPTVDDATPPVTPVNPPPATPTTPTAKQASRSAPARPSASAGALPAGAEQKGSQPGVAPSRPASSRPEASRADKAAEATPVPISPRQPSLLSRLQTSAYTFQAGVFVDPQRAEDVYAKLVLEGIPATLETRVLVGPFRNRNEAEAARVRMKALGIDALPISRSGKK